jgi:hypothetical protein
MKFRLIETGQPFTAFTAFGPQRPFLPPGFAPPSAAHHAHRVADSLALRMSSGPYQHQGKNPLSFISFRRDLNNLKLKTAEFKFHLIEF